MLEVIAPEWNGLPVITTRAAAYELDRLHFNIPDAIGVLEDGYDCARSKRKKNVLEKCVKKGNKAIKIVAARCYNNFLKKEAWLIIHAGKFK